MMLKDAPGGAEFIAILADAAAKLSLLYSHTPDDRAQASLDDYLSRIEPCVIEAVGASQAPLLLAAFHRAVMGGKHKMEVSGASLA